MAERAISVWRRFTLRLRAGLSRIDTLALFPLFAVTAIWLELGDIVTLTAFLLPALLAFQALVAPTQGVPAALGPTGQAPPGQEALLAMLDRVDGIPHRSSACILVELDDWQNLIDRWGADHTAALAQRCYERLETCLRRDDLITRLGDVRFGIVLHPIPAARLGLRETIVGRLRAALGEAMVIDGVHVRLTACIGHSGLLRDAADCAAATLVAAEAALAEAHRIGPNTVRAYTPGLLRERAMRNQLVDEVAAALANGEIRAWFQPQIGAKTNRLCGFEALARWHHPDRGILLPKDFLGAVESAGKMATLGHTILCQSLTALRAWDDAGLDVPTVSVNFSASELRDPNLVEQILWELDRFDLRPNRLIVEILETVAAENRDDAVIATLERIKSCGIRLDLDDFGVGQASLAAIPRFGVSRIKIDRSFIKALDEESETHAMVDAILSIARHLGVECLAEGVETAQVQTLLAQKGCGYCQGFLIAEPMPFEDTEAWINAQDHRPASRHEPQRQVG